MVEERAQLIGVVMVLVPLTIWVLGAFGLFGVEVPSQHFATLIWAGVSLIVGHNARSLWKRGDKAVQIKKEKDEDDT